MRKNYLCEYYRNNMTQEQLENAHTLFLSYLFWKKVWLFWQNYAIIIVNVFGGENNARVTNVFVTISFTIA